MGGCRIEDLVVEERESTRQREKKDFDRVRDLLLFQLSTPTALYIFNILLPIKDFTLMIHPLTLLIDHVQNPLTQVLSY